VNDYASVVDDLRAFLQSPDQVVTEQITARATRYAQFCTEANQRLRRCEEFLRKGLRAEAIQFAQAEPALLELFFALDFPERGHLDEVTTAYGLPVPPRLNVDAARALQQAVADAEPLSDLLRQHRLLALGRAPVLERLRVLRRLSEADSTNPLWPDCVQNFEKARLRTIEVETEEALRKKDTAAITRLHAELTINRWLAKPPPALVKRITEAAQVSLRAQARLELVKLEKELNNAYSQGDLNTCRQWRDKWQQMVGPACLPGDDPLHEQVAPALEWVDGQEALAAADSAYEADVGALSGALNRVLTRSQLEDLMRAVQKHGRGFPPELAERCRERRQRMLSAEKMRKILIFAGSVAAVVIFAAIGILVYWSGLQSQQADKVVADISHLLDNREFDGARKYVSALQAARPELFEREDVHQAVVLMEGKLREEDARLKEFERFLKDELRRGAEPRGRRAQDDRRPLCFGAEEDPRRVPRTTRQGEGRGRQGRAGPEADGQDVQRPPRHLGRHGPGSDQVRGRLEDRGGEPGQEGQNGRARPHAEPPSPGAGAEVG
jgi:hypothetical protein